MQRVQTIYAGASARHIGTAVREGAGALLLERTVHVAPEYIESFRPCPDEPAGGALSGGIRRALEQDGFIQNGCLHAQAAEHLLMAALADSGAQALFCTEILFRHAARGRRARNGAVPGYRAGIFLRRAPEPRPSRPAAATTR